MSAYRCLIFVMGLVFFFAGCNKDDMSTGKNSYNNYISQCDTIISLDNICIIDPQIVCIKDSTVVLSTEYVLYSYQCESGRLNELVNVGEGPCDVVDFTSVGLSDDGKIWVYDGNVGKYITVDLCTFQKNAQMIPEFRMLNELQPISSNRLIGVPYGKSAGYYLFNSEGDIIQ